MRILTVLALAAFIWAPATLAQAPPVGGAAAFTAEDMLDIVTATVLDLSDDGRRVAVSLRRSRDNSDVDNYRYGDPTYLSPSRVRLQAIDASSGAVQEPFEGLVNLRGAAWSRDGTRLAILLSEPGEPAGPTPASRARAARGVPSKAAPRTARPGFVVYVWDAAKAVLSEVPQKSSFEVAGNTGVEWTADDARLVLSYRSPEWAKKAASQFKLLTAGPIVVHSSKEPFLEWDALQRTSRSRIVGELDVVTGEVKVVLPERKLSSFQVARDGSFVTFMEDVTEKTDYEQIGGTTNVLKMIGPDGGEPKTLVEAKDLQGLQLRWSDDGRTFAYAKQGEVFVQRVDEAKPRSLTPPPPGEKKGEGAKPAEAAATAPPRSGEKPPEERRETFSVVSFSRDASKLLVTSRKGWYVINVADAKRDLILPLDEENEERNPRLQALEWAPDGTSIYLSSSERDRWHRGFERLDIATRVRTPLLKDDRLYGGFRMSRNGSVILFTMSDGNRPGELYASSPDFTSPRKLTDTNPWLASRTVPRSELVSYRDADGKELYGVLRYPAGYVKGQRYPTVFEIYETFFDNGFNARAAFLTSNGYAVFHPSVNLVVGRPGEAWVKGVTAAANKLIEMGVSDPDRLGVHGTSYGGYATVLLITQTDRFKAAINISGKVNMVSFYTDSPRLGVRNIHAPERSQDRIGGTLWEYPERYLEHSAVLRADRIKTPLLCITGDQDPNVPASQSREIYYALRRLGKEVEWVRYVNGAHRPPSGVEESIDFEKRILAWYDKYLKAEPKKKITS
ncbi:MAG: prolyl oligopeptidase family serine peptidase [Vicinamibacterales bacterium]